MNLNMKFLDLLQKVNDFLHRTLGLNTVTLELQVFINSRRYKKDVVDDNEIVFTDDEGFDFVQ